MTSPIDALREEWYINTYLPKNDKSPRLTIELKHKTSGEKFRHAVWLDKKDPTKCYMAKAEGQDTNQQEPRPMSIHDIDDENDVPF